MKKMYLNLYKLTLSQVFLMSFDSKFKIKSYYKHFPVALEICIRFPKFTVFFSNIYVCINGEVICG